MTQKQNAKAPDLLSLNVEEEGLWLVLLLWLAVAVCQPDLVKEDSSHGAPLVPTLKTSY